MSVSLQITRRVDALDWANMAAALEERGHAVVPRLLAAGACADLVRLYADADRFRSRVVMQRHAFGQGEYQYFARPLPPVVAELRAHFYPPLARIANDWAGALRLERRFPDTLEAFSAMCARAGQTKPTPLMLKYGPGDYNCLHRDLYGDVVFPLQMTVALSQHGADFEGGEFLLVEQRPRKQSRAEVVPLDRGDAVIFPVNERPVAGSRGVYRTATRHGLSRVRAGARYALGIIFHDAA